MESISSSEKVASIDLDSYLEALPVSDVIDGRIMEDENHLFYHWLSKTYPQFNDIDGVSLEDLYLKNVIEVGMTVTDFFRYCDTHSFPCPLFNVDEVGLQTYYDLAFSSYKDAEAAKKIEEYKIWAADHGIETIPGSIMKFYDSEGILYRVRTDAENYGQIIVD